METIKGYCTTNLDDYKMIVREIIKGYCTTNLDDYKMIVREFYRVPNVGERVVCMYKGHKTSLKVCQITHDIKNDEPYIIVELHN